MGFKLDERRLQTKASENIHTQKKKLENFNLLPLTHQNYYFIL